MQRPSPTPPPRFYGAGDDVFSLALHEPSAGRRVPEALVQDLWLTQRFRPGALRTTAGEPVAIRSPGRHNTDGGPDFLDARLRYGETDWVGSVEVHVTSGAWYEHGHDRDPRYNSVVLHVTLEADVWTGHLRRSDGSILPEVVLAPLLEAPLRTLLHAFLTRPADALPCAPGWPRVPASIRSPWLATLADERIREKGGTAATLAGADEALHLQLFTGLGYAPNAEAMATLARRLPLLLVRPFDDLVDLEALHLGTAGLLPTPADLLGADRTTADYVMDLRERYDRLQYRLEIPPMARTQWQFFRLRPANFPPLRIAQAVALLTGPGAILREDPVGRLLEACRAPRPLGALRRLLRATPTPFWKTHVRLERATPLRNPTVGRRRADALLVNAVVPVLLRHTAATDAAADAARLHDLLHLLPPATDQVLRRFADLGTRPADAFEAQGLHQLYRTRCLQGRCLTCPIGQYLLEGR